MADAKAVDVLIVAALQDELDAVLEGSDEWTEQRDQQRQTFFTRKFPQARGRALSIAAACSGMGETATAVHTTTLISHLDPALVVMSGICAGKRGSVRLGDVIVAERVYSYDHGKLIHEESEALLEFHHDIETFAVDRAWRTDIEAFARKWSFAQTPPPLVESQKNWILWTLLDHERGLSVPPREHSDQKTHCPE